LLAGSVLTGLRRQRFIEPSDQLALLLGEVHGGLDDHPAEEVPARAPTHGLHSLVAETKDAPRLGLGRNLQLHVPPERRHGDGAPERRGGEAHRHLAGEVLPVALEDRMLAHVALDIPAPGRAPPQVSQVAGWLPLAAPLPLHTSHSASRATSISAWWPNTAWGSSSSSS